MKSSDRCIILLDLEGKEVPALPNSEFIGQIALLERINSILLLHGGADWLPGHMLFQGENGSGRKSVARALAAALRVEFQAIDASSFQQAADLTALLTNLPQRSVLCIANLEALKPALQDRLASALRTGSVDVTIGLGPAAKKHVMAVRPLTCVLCVTPRTRLTPALREALPFLFAFADYSPAELLEICLLSAHKLGLEINESDATAILGRADPCQPGEISRLVASIAALAGLSADRTRLGEAFIALGIKGGASIDAESQPDFAAPNLHEQIQTMNGYEFEHFITATLAKFGFRAETTQASGDGGIDIVAHCDHPLLGGKFVIQCKRYLPGNNIGRPTLQEFCGAVHTDKEHPRLVFITTSSFTKEARSYAKGVGIQLVDGEILAVLLKGPQVDGVYGDPIWRFDELTGGRKFADGGHDISDQADKVRVKRFETPDMAQAWALSNRSSLYGVELWTTNDAKVVARFVPKPPQRLFQDP